MIETHQLTKTFGSIVAVDDLNLSVRPGEIFGLLGPNGAGKSTTLAMILGVLAPTRGDVRIFGRRLQDDPFAIKQRLGVVAEDLSFYDDMTAWAYLLFFANLYRVASTAPRVRDLLTRVDLWEWRHTLIRDYSLGMRRKLSLARALLHSPDVLILDEPVANLDPYGIAQVRELLAEERAAGRTILISSHLLSEVEQTADRVAIMTEGKLVIEATMPELRDRIRAERRIDVELVDNVDGLMETLQALPFVVHVQQRDHLMTIVTAADRDYRVDVGRELASRGAIVQGMREIETTLEEAFMTLTEAYVRNGAAR